jgi:NADH:ubiquinone reductase (H+-translocating)
MQHVVIIGGGFGGLSAARALAREPVRVTLIDRLNHHLFQPLLYQVAMAGLSPADIAYPIRTVFRRQDQVRVLLADVVGLDLTARRVRLQDGSPVDYDFVVLAAGARTNWFGKEQFRSNTLGLKSIDDALEIRRRVLLAFEAAERETQPEVRKRLLTFAIIGGGPTGVEISGTLRELADFVLSKDFRTIHPDEARVVLVEMQDRLLPGGFDPKLAVAAKRQLEQIGVEVRLSSPVKSIDERGVRLETDRIPAATVLWTAGVRAEDLTGTLGAELDRAGRVLVEPDCSIPGHPEAFAIGDIARFVPEGSDQPLPGVAPVAMQQGRHVARVIAAAIGGEPRQAFRYRDKGIMATIGRSRAVVQSGHGRLKISGFFAWVTWIFIHIWYLIGFRNRVSVLLNWAWNYVTYGQGARLITGHRAWELLPQIADRAERGALASRGVPGEQPKSTTPLTEPTQPGQ